MSQRCQIDHSTFLKWWQWLLIRNRIRGSLSRWTSMNQQILITDKKVTKMKWLLRNTWNETRSWDLVKRCRTSVSGRDNSFNTQPTTRVKSKFQTTKSTPTKKIPSKTTTRTKRLILTKATISRTSVCLLIRPLSFLNQGQFPWAITEVPSKETWVMDSMNSARIMWSMCQSSYFAALMWLKVKNVAADMIATTQLINLINNRSKRTLESSVRTSMTVT